MQAVGKIMTKNVIAAKAKDYAGQVMLQILSGQYSGMPVIGPDNRVIGVISEFDLLKAIKQGLSLDSTFVEAVMTKDPITVELTATVDEVIDVMIQKGIIRVPVVEGGKLVGVVSRSDLLMAYYHSDSIIKL